MAGKAFTISVILDVHHVSCPGVWLCPKGSVVLKLEVFGASCLSKPLPPSFPLVCRERFVFQKVFGNVRTLGQLQEVLLKREVRVEAVQVGGGGGAVRLASFCSPVSRLLYPGLHKEGVSPHTDLDLLLTPSNTFPGILGPKVNISARLSIDEMKKQKSDEFFCLNPFTVDSKEESLRKGSGIIRQKRVCHSKDRFPCGCYGGGTAPSRPQLRTSCAPSGGAASREAGAARAFKTDLSRTPPQGGPDSEETRGTSSSEEEEEEGESCECRICRKYRGYFPAGAKGGSPPPGPRREPGTTRVEEEEEGRLPRRRTKSSTHVGSPGGRRPEEERGRRSSRPPPPPPTTTRLVERCTSPVEELIQVWTCSCERRRREDEEEDEGKESGARWGRVEEGRGGGEVLGRRRRGRSREYKCACSDRAWTDKDFRISPLESRDDPLWTEGPAKTRYPIPSPWIPEDGSRFVEAAETSKSKCHEDCSTTEQMKKCETYRHLFYENLEAFYRKLLGRVEDAKEKSRKSLLRPT